MLKNFSFHIIVVVTVSARDELFAVVLWDERKKRAFRAHVGMVGPLLFEAEFLGTFDVHPAGVEVFLRDLLATLFAHPCLAVVSGAAVPQL